MNTEEFPLVQMLLSLFQTGGQKQQNHFVGIADTGMQSENLLPPAGLVARLFGQLPAGTSQGSFTGIQLSRRDFPQGLPHRITELPHQNQLTVAGDGQNGSGAAVLQMLPNGLAPVGQTHFVAEEVQQSSTKDLSTVYGGFLQIQGPAHTSIYALPRPKRKKGLKNPVHSTLITFCRCRGRSRSRLRKRASSSTKS